MRTALNYHVVVRPIPEKNHKVAGGLELAIKFDNELRYLKGTIVSVGSKVVSEMKAEPVQLEDGDTVWYDRHAGHEIRWTDDESLKVLKLGDLVSVDK